jgi:L-ascorbate metabolism protein UlaG (beta-lactamase superfamily)
MTAHDFKEDVIQTCQGELTITFVGHGTLMFELGGRVIHVDPVSAEADYGAMPKADIVLVTHEHGDHLDAKAIELVRKPTTTVIAPTICASAVADAKVMANGDTCEIDGIGIEAVPAYNMVHMRSPGQPFHPRGVGNGYVITFGDKQVYVAADTENTPEMKALNGIDVAFLPMNLPYTMTPEMVADAARAFRPALLYPYHYGSTNVAELTALLDDEPEIEVRIRRMQ